MNASTESLSLGWISLDLDRHIETAKNAFESYLSSVEEKAGSGKLEESLQHTQDCVSTFQQVELATAAALTTEIADVLQQLVDGNASNKDEAYQVVIGGYNQLLNYLGRLKRSGCEEPVIVLAVINDIRAAAGKKLLLPEGQFAPSTESGASSSGVQSDLQQANAAVLTQLCSDVTSSLQAIADSPEEQRESLLAAKKGLICSDWQKLGLPKDSLITEFLLASEAIVGGALRNGNKLPIAARHTVASVFATLSSQLENTEAGVAAECWEQLRDALLFCLCLTSDASESASYLFARYQLDKAIRTDHSSELLHLGTPDYESIAIVLDSLAGDITVLQNGLQSCAEAGGDFADAGDLAAMAANLQYTLQLVQFHSVANQLEGVVEQLGSAQSKGSIDVVRLEAIAGKLFEVEAQLQKIRAGSGRDASEITVIEQLQSSCAQVRELSERVASLDLESARKLIADQQVAAEMNSALEPVEGQLAEIVGAARFIRSDQLVDVVSAMSNFYHGEIAAPLQASQIEGAQQACSKFSAAVAGLESYLDALKESNHALVDNLLLKVGECIDIAPTRVIADADADATPILAAADNCEDALDAPAETDSVVQPTEAEQVSGFVEQPLADEIDDEIAEIFLEEAEEVFETLNENYALLQEDSGNESALAEIRRGYHTLKGSGRMAGAEDVGNAAWAVESLLNRVIDNTISLNEQRLALVGEANEYLPVLTGYFSRRVQPFAPALESLVQRAEQSAAAEDAGVEVGVSLQLEASKAGSTSDAAVEAPVDAAAATVDDEVVAVDDVVVEPSAEETAVESIDVIESIESSDTPIDPVVEDSVAETESSNEAVDFDIDSTDTDFVLEQSDTEDPVIPEVTAEEIVPEQPVEEPAPVAAAEPVEEEPVEEADPVEELESIDESVLVESAEPEFIEDDHATEPELSEEEQELASLREVFVEESAVQLVELESYIAAGAGQLPEEPIERALHTLAGGARIASLDSFANLVAPAEKLVGAIRRDASITPERFALLEDVVAHIRGFVSSEGADCPDFSSIITALEAQLSSASTGENEVADSAIADLSSHCSLVLDAKSFLHTWRVSSGTPPAYQAMLDEIAQIAADSQHEQAITRLCESLVAAYQCFAEHGFHQQAYRALLSAHAELVDMLDAMAAGLPLRENAAAELDLLVADEMEVAQLAAAQLEQTSEAGSSTDDQLDREIVNIFLEESVDLVEEVESAVTAWVDDTKNDEYLEVLLRPLHTLKGGARMAGLESVGDLCHEFETLLQAVKNGEKKADARFFKKIQSHLVALSGCFNEAAESPVASEQAQAAEKAEKTEKRIAEMVRVPSDLLDGLVNLAGETSISRSLVEEKIADFTHSIDEIDATVERLKEQLRRLEIETEAQIAFRREKVEIEGQEEFDPLEMDRYSQLQQLSKSLVESASDLKDLKGTLRDRTRDVETLLLQQSRINTELQEGLMRTRTVPLSRTIVPRLRKTVRQVSGELDKPVTFEVGSSDGELDKSVIERMVAPLEHVLRNAIDHGIETVEQRTAAGKPASGAIQMTINREGSDVVLRISDDGKGIDTEAVRAKAVEKGLISADQVLSEDAVQQLVFSPGFSTAQAVTQISGRGVGMDVVRSEIQELGGSVELHSVAGKGTTFVFRLPFTMSMNRALLVSAGGESIAVPLDTIEGIVRVSPFELEEYYGEQAVEFMYAGQQYDFRYLGSMLNGSAPQYSTDMVGALPVLLVRANEQLIAYQVDRLLGSREIVVKSLGAQFTELAGIIGATVLGDGSVVMIADLGALGAGRQQLAPESGGTDSVVPATRRDRMVAMVVDDSVTVRKVTTRLLEREGFDVVTAKDGLDAMDKLEEVKPDFMLLDIEMPRLDGFEVVSRVRHDPRLADLPIIMITSRTGDKHRERALSLGANEFLGKPYQDQLLMEKIALVAPDLGVQGAAEQAG